MSYKALVLFLYLVITHFTLIRYMAFTSRHDFMLSLFRQANTCWNYKPSIYTRILSIINKTFLPSEDNIMPWIWGPKMLINYIPVIQNPVGSSKTVRSCLNFVLLLPWESGQPDKHCNYLWLKVCILAQQKNTSTWGFFCCLSLSEDKRTDTSISQRYWVKEQNKTGNPSFQ